MKGTGPLCLLLLASCQVSLSGMVVAPGEFSELLATSSVYEQISCLGLSL